jgi:hypothetical protein
LDTLSDNALMLKVKNGDIDKWACFMNDIIVSYSDSFLT